MNVSMETRLPAGVRAPLQTRSRKTFTDILVAAEKLMNQKTWVDVTVSDIVKEANCTVGSFYARFDDKHAVLACLSSQLSADVEQQSATQLSSGNLTPSLLIQGFAHQLCDVYEQRVGLIRTLTLLPRLYGDTSFQNDGQRTALVFRSIVDQFVTLGVDRSRTEIALFFLVNAIRERVLFPDISSQMIDVDDESFKQGLVDAFLAFTLPGSKT